MHPFENEEFRFGTARFATEAEIAAAGMFDQSRNGFFTGFLGNRPLFYDDMGGIVMVAGARSGKMRDFLSYNLFPGVLGDVTTVMLDPKGEGAYVAQDQTEDQKKVINWNPAGLLGLPQHSLNPFELLHMGNPNLVSDTMNTSENWVPLSGAPQGEYFEVSARQIFDAIALVAIKRHGALHAKDLYRYINLIATGGDEWANFAWDMHNSDFEIARRVEAEIHKSRDDTSGGFRGVLGELFKSIRCLNDPRLMESISPPYDLKLSDLTSSDQAYQVFLMPPAEFISQWSPVLRAIFVTLRIYKSRAPSAPQQTIILDECARLGRFPLLFDMFSYGAGIGQRTAAVYQSFDQMNKTGPNGKAEILASAALQIVFAVRELDSARMVSEMIGDQTLNFNDLLKQGLAGTDLAELRKALADGADPVDISRRLLHLAEAEIHRTKMQRRVRMPDEILRTPRDKAYLFTDGVEFPILADRKPYYEQASMAGRFHPNPYVPDQPLDKVRVKTRLGHAWRRVITESVPPKFADYPQYSDGTWSRIARW